MGKLVILGAIGNCLDIFDAWRAARSASLMDDDLIGFLDDGRLDSVVEGLPVIGPLSQASTMDGVRFICGIGGPRSYRQKPEIIARLGLPQQRYATIVHPAATISPSARIGTGSCILANATICANVELGMHVMMLPGCVIGHDTTIGDCSILAAGVIVSGNVEIGRNCYLGAGSVLRDGVSIGERAMVGLGAGVVGDVASGVIVTGLPARPREASA